MSAAIPLTARHAAPRTLPPLDRAGAEEAQQLTLLELVRAVGEVTDDEDEIVATVLHMLQSGSVRLCGNFRNREADLFSR